MFNRIKLLLTFKRAPRAERGDKQCLRRQIERLDDRAMLSATMGSMAYGSGGDNFAPSSGGPRPGEATMIASPSQHFSGHDRQGARAERFAGPTYGGLHDGSYGMNGPGMGRDTNRYGSGPAFYDSHVPQQSTWAEFPSSAPPPKVYYVTFVPSTPQLDNYSHSPPPAFNELPIRSPSPIVNTPVIAPKASAAMRPPGSGEGGSPAQLLFPALTSLRIPAALSAIPTASQIVTRDIDSAAMLSSGALDVAFQSYASQLLLVTTSARNDHVTTKAVDDASVPAGEVFDGFIGLTDVAIASDEKVPLNAEQQEREAVDAVLRDLQDLEALPVDPMSAVREVDSESVTVDTELHLSPFNNPLDEMPVNDAEGGMVMLEASDDTNESVLNLVDAHDDSLAQFNVPVGVEASVGFYQAVDAAIEDVPAAANLAPATPAVEPARQNEPDNQLSTESETGSSRKAAAVIGATTFVGGLLWSGLRNRHEEELAFNSGDEKNRRRVVAS